MNDPSGTIVSTDTRELLEARDAALNKVLKLKLLLNEIRSLNLGPEETPEIKRALRLVSVGEFLRLGDEQIHLLGKQIYSKLLKMSNCILCGH